MPSGAGQKTAHGKRDNPDKIGYFENFIAQ
jgi:hypothetical protein